VCKSFEAEFLPHLAPESHANDTKMCDAFAYVVANHIVYHWSHKDGANGTATEEAPPPEEPLMNASAALVNHMKRAVRKAAPARAKVAPARAKAHLHFQASLRRK